MKKYINFFLILFIFPLSTIIFPFLRSAEVQRNEDDVVIIQLKKIRELRENFFEGESNYFWNVNDLSCDQAGNLYVADSGWNKIFKFDHKGTFVCTIGREGQGPGEFLSQPKRLSLNVTVGNDGNLYVVDAGNRRLSIFSAEGNFIKSFPFQSIYSDKAQASSKGDIYLISKDGKNLINCYDTNYVLKDSFLNTNLHFKFPIYKPLKLMREVISSTTVKKVITKKDHLLVLSNNSLKIFHFNEKNILINKFKIENEVFVENFRIRLKLTIERGGFISPFNILTDDNDDLYLCYFNSAMKNWEMHKYNLKGKFLGILRFPEKVRQLCSIDHLGNIHCLLNRSSIGTFTFELQ